jgi:ribonuclease HI
MLVSPRQYVIATDCEYVIEYLTRICHSLEQKQWTKDIRNKELLQAVFYQYTALPHVRLLKVRAHTSSMDRHSIGNRGAHQLAITAARCG